MARVRRPGAGTDCVLPAQTLIGRSPACTLRLDDPLCSSEHAKLSWNGRRWELRDLGSRNGTFVGDRRLVPGQAERLRSGDRLRFGPPRETWVLESADPPTGVAQSLDDGTLHAAVDGLLALPDGDAPAIVLYSDPLGRWCMEGSDGEVAPVVEQQIVVAGGERFRLHLPASSESTPLLDQPTLTSVRLRFRVSRDQEFVELDLVLPDRVIELEARDHWHLLLVLATLRRDDRQLPPPERGWVEREELERMLAMDENALNVAVHRARSQILAAGVAGGSGIVEVRKGRRRLGTDRFEILESQNRSAST